MWENIFAVSPSRPIGQTHEKHSLESLSPLSRRLLCLQILLPARRGRRIGHLGAITPAITFFCTPLWGALTDKTGCLRQILVITFLSSVVFRVGLVAHTSYLWIVSLISLTAIMNAPVRPLLDSGALQSLEDKSEYGKQRLWGQWGFGVSARDWGM